jgi:branched-chain amino acid transport system permease protein
MVGFARAFSLLRLLNSGVRICLGRSMSFVLNRKWTVFTLTCAAVAVVLLLWRPTVLIYGVQRAGLYAAIALPMALVLGIVHIVNLAHGEFMMVAAYVTYGISRLSGLDPLLSVLPATIVMVVLGIVIYQLTIRRAVDAPELNQLILTFGIAMVLSQTVNLIATSQPRKISLEYVSASVTIGELSFGVYDFVFVLLAIAILAGLMYFLRRTRLGKSAAAVGQNPRGAGLVGIHVQRTYLIVFSLAAGLMGIVGAFFLTKTSIFPGVGGPFTMKSFCLVAMAGIGNLPMVAAGSLLLGIAESFIVSFRGMSGWAPIVFFALIIAVIVVRSYQERKR